MRASKVTACTLATIAWGMNQAAIALPALQSATQSPPIEAAPLSEPDRGDGVTLPVESYPSPEAIAPTEVSPVPNEAPPEPSTPPDETADSEGTGAPPESPSSESVDPPPTSSLIPSTVPSAPALSTPSIPETISVEQVVEEVNAGNFEQARQLIESGGFASNVRLDLLDYLAEKSARPPSFPSPAPDRPSSPQPTAWMEQSTFPGMAQQIRNGGDRLPDLASFPAVQNQCGVVSPTSAQVLAHGAAVGKQVSLATLRYLTEQAWQSTPNQRSLRQVPPCPFPKFTTTKLLQSPGEPTGGMTPAVLVQSDRTQWRFPLPMAAEVTSGFGWRQHPITGDRRFHDGVDFGAPEGTPVLAAQSGRVVFADWMGGYGLTVVIEHSPTQQTLYAHLSSLVVEPGSWVDAGAIVGKVGSTGNSTGPHLHFEVRQQTAEGWTAVDPSLPPETAAIQVSAIASTVSSTVNPTTRPTAPAPNASQPAPTLPTVQVAATPDILPPCEETGCATAPAIASAAVAQLPPPPDVPTSTTDWAIAPVSRSSALSVEAIVAQHEATHPNITETRYWIELCQSLAAAGHYTEALAACDRAISLQPREGQTWVARGQVLVQLGQHEEAIAAYTYALRRNPNDSLALTYRCDAYARSGQFDAALADCDRALAIDTHWGTAAPSLAHHNRGLILLQQQHYPEAIAAFNQVLDLEPSNAVALAHRGRAELMMGDAETALATCDRALDISRTGQLSPAIAWYNRGLALTALDRPQEAIAAYQEVLALEQGFADVWTNQGILLEQVQRPQDALIALQQATQLAPDSSLAWLYQAKVLNQLGQHTPALAAADQALQGDQQWGGSSVAAVWTERATALNALGQYEQGLAAADRAVGLAPEAAAGWNSRAMSLMQLNRPGEAIAATVEATDLNPDDGTAWHIQGQVFQKHGSYGEALMAYDAALNLHPNRTTQIELLLSRSVVLWRLGQLEDSLETTDRLLNLNPALAEGWHTKGSVLLTMNQYAGAIAAYDYAIALDPLHHQAWVGRGTALRFLGQEADALAAFERVNQLQRNASEPGEAAPQTSEQASA